MVGEREREGGERERERERFYFMGKVDSGAVHTQLPP